VKSDATADMFRAIGYHDLATRKLRRVPQKKAKKTKLDYYVVHVIDGGTGEFEPSFVFHAATFSDARRKIARWEIVAGCRSGDVSIENVGTMYPYHYRGIELHDDWIE